ncbi:hypothetical protein HAX42_14570 [Enterococcus casseliflavus]|nr:hypothetical protein [Enterococcus casseliflavus]
MYIQSSLELSKRYHLNKMNTLTYKDALQHYEFQIRDIQNIRDRSLYQDEKLLLDEAKTILHGHKILGQNDFFQKAVVSTVRNNHAVLYTKASTKILQETMNRKIKSYWIKTSSRKQKLQDYEADINKFKHLERNYVDNIKYAKLSVMNYLVRYCKEIIPPSVVTHFDLRMDRGGGTTIVPSAPRDYESTMVRPSAPREIAPKYDIGAPPSYEAATTNRKQEVYEAPPPYTPYENLITSLTVRGKQELGVTEQDVRRLNQLTTRDHVINSGQIEGGLKITTNDKLEERSNNSRTSYSTEVPTSNVQPQIENVNSRERSKSLDLPELNNLPNLDSESKSFKNIIHKAKQQSELKQSEILNKRNLNKERGEAVLAN